MGQMAQDPDQMLVNLERQKREKSRRYQDAADSVLNVSSGRIQGVRQQGFWGDTARGALIGGAGGAAAGTVIPGLGTAAGAGGGLLAGGIVGAIQGLTGNNYDSVTDPQLKKVVDVGPLGGRTLLPGMDAQTWARQFAIAELKARDPKLNLDANTREGKQNLLLAREYENFIADRLIAGENVYDARANNEKVTQLYGKRNLGLQQKADQAKAEAEQITLARADRAFQEAQQRRQSRDEFSNALIGRLFGAIR